MSLGSELLAALSEPLRAIADPSERIFWGFVVTSLAMPWLVVGIRRGTAELRNGLFQRRIWAHASSRADIVLVFVKALLMVPLRIPWVAATASATLWVGLTLHEVLGPPSAPDWSPTTIAVVYSLVLFVGWDASRFAVHWLMHRVSWLWAFHEVHHSARVLTPLTLYRTHPLETMIYDLRGLAATAALAGPFIYLFPGRVVALELLGIHALGFVFNAAGANLRHSHVWLRFGALERWFIAPAQHQMHHATDPSLQRSNYGTWLALWDRIAGSWRASTDRAPEAYGLEEAHHRFDGVGSMLLRPLAHAARLILRRPVAVAAVAVLMLASADAGAAPAAEPGAVAPGDAAPGDPTPPAAESPETEPPAAEPTPETSPKEDPPAPEPSDASPGEPAEAPPPQDTTPAPPGDAADPPADTASPSPPQPVDTVSSLTPEPPDPDPEPEPPPAEPEPAPESAASTESTRKIVVGSMFDGDELPRVAGSAHVITEKELERHEYDDVHKVLATVPGVYVRGEDGFGLRPNIGLRGANPDRSAKVTLLEDGVLLGPAPYSAPAAYYFPLTTRMVGMEVYKGLASIKHGPNTIGGAINLRTREIPDDHASVVDVAAGRFGYVKGHGYYGTTYKGFGVLLEAARVQTTGFKELDGGGDTGFGRNDAMVKLGYETPSERAVTHDIELKGGFATENSNETYLGISRSDFESTPYRRYAASDGDNMSWWRSQAELTYVLRKEETMEVEARLYRHDFDRVWRRLNAFRGGPALTDVLSNPDTGQTAVLAAILRGEQDALLPQQALLVTNNDRRFVSQGVQTAFRWRPEWKIVKQELEIGARVHNDAIVRDHSDDAFIMTSGTMVPEGSDRVDTVQNEATTIAAAFHVYDAITLWDRLTVAPGVRVEVISMRFEDRLADERRSRLDNPLSPGAGALFMATPWLSVFASAHRGFSPVAPGQPEDVEPEFSMNYELGSRLNLRGIHAEAVGFVSDYDNLNGACTFSAGCVDGDGSQQFNAGAVLVYGAELLARYRHRFDSGFGFEAGARYTYTGSRFGTTFQSSFPQWGDVEEGFELPYVPKHIVGGTFGVGGRIWDVAVSPNYNGVMRDVAGQGPIAGVERVPGFFTLDIATEVRVLKRFRIYGQVANATNTPYIASRRPFGIRPGAPLTFMFGVKAYVLP
ncbi:MAG: TonB-dependent receptor [Myxococcota bacterium]